MSKMLTFKQGILKFYFLTLMVMAVGAGIAAHTNWEIYLEANKESLARDAKLTSTLIDNTLTSALKSLEAGKLKIHAALQKGAVNPAMVSGILSETVNDFIRYTPTDVYGLLFFVDKHGQLLARSGEYPTRAIDFTDRYYYQDLRDNPSKSYTIGPLIKARTTGKYVFHIAVPVQDKHGEFYGVLVQQIAIDDLSELLQHLLNGSTEQLVMHHPEQVLSFIYPNKLIQKPPSTISQIAQEISASSLKRGCLTLKPQPPNSDNLLVGFCDSSSFGFVTSATLPMQDLQRTFLRSNQLLILYTLLGIAFFFISILAPLSATNSPGTNPFHR